MFILYLATTAATATCATTCSGAFDSTGTSTCSLVCYDTGSGCNASSTACPNSIVNNAPITLNGFVNNYCNSAATLNGTYGPGGIFYGFNPCGGSGTNTDNGGLVPSVGTCCVYDAAIGDYFCIYHPSCSPYG